LRCSLISPLDGLFPNQPHPTWRSVLFGLPHQELPVVAEYPVGVIFQPLAIATNATRNRKTL
jgi:hypothetical protein